MRSFLVLLAVSACGAVETSGPSGTPLEPRTEPTAEKAPDVFVRQAASGLEVVAVNLTNGAATPVAPAVPGTENDDLTISEIVRSGSRLVVTVVAKSDATRSATYSLDPDAKRWRDLGLVGSRSDVTRGLGLIVGSGYQTSGSLGPRAVKIVTYEGKVIFDTGLGTSADNRYPRVEAISPTGQWFAMRAAEDAVLVREIAVDGTVGSARALAAPEPDQTYTSKIVCSLPTTMLVADDAPAKVSWIDSTLAPVGDGSFRGSLDALPPEFRYDACRYQVTSGDVRDVYRFSDRALTKEFSFPGKDAILIAAGEEFHVRAESGPVRVIAANDGSVSARYTPLSPNAPVPPHESYQVSLSTLAVSLGTASTALVVGVSHSTFSGDAGEQFEADDELFVVDAAGTAKPIARLDSRPGIRFGHDLIPQPGYRFTTDGANLVYVKDGRIHVRSTVGDPSVDRAFDGRFVDVTVREATP